MSASDTSEPERADSGRMTAACAITAHVTLRTRDLNEADAAQVAADFAALLQTSASLAAEAHDIVLDLKVNTVIAEARMVIPLRVVGGTQAIDPR